MPENTYAGKLKQGGFSLRNHHLLESLIMTHGKHGTGDAPRYRPYAVCDWDNTSVCGDTEVTLVYSMLDNLSFSFSIGGFRAAVSLNVPRGDSMLLNSKGEYIVFDDLIEDLVDDYAFLFNNYIGMGGRADLAGIKLTEEYKDFAAKCFVLFEALEATWGTAIADQWQGQLLSGMTSERLMELSEKAMQGTLGAELCERKAGFSIPMISNAAARACPRRYQEVCE
jgi:hypothetical protein